MITFLIGFIVGFISFPVIGLGLLTLSHLYDSVKIGY